MSKPFEDLAEAMRWAKDNFPGCSYSVKEQADGPTIISVKHKETKELRSVIYVKQRKID